MISTKHLFLCLISTFHNFIPLIFFDADQCSIKDFDYQYTNCNNLGGRWRVAVPKSGRNCRGNVPFPEKGLNCSFSCPIGKYLDLKTQECQSCAPGSYSLGGGIRFEDFSHFPYGFQVENFHPDSESKTNVDCPKNTGWTVEKNRLIYLSSPCLSKLSYTIHLVRPGHVEYVYRMPKNSLGLMFTVDVKNEQCKNYRDELNAIWSSGTNSNSRTNGAWQKSRIYLRSGPNIITWSVANTRENEHNIDSIVIARIDIIGIAFTKKCTLCPAGTYSSAEAKDCTPCKAGQYSTIGADSCLHCPEAQYSGPKAFQCIDRPKCTENDFYPVHEACIAGITTVSYKSVCRRDLPGSVEKPPKKASQKCPKCNPGMSLNKTGNCHFCAKTYYSDGNECSKCPVETVPNLGYQYEWWHNLPQNMETRCLFVNEDEYTKCDIGESWLPSGNSIHTTPTHQSDTILELLLTIPNGFSNPLMPQGVDISLQNPVGHVTFVFETKCTDHDCIFYFVQKHLSNLFVPKTLQSSLDNQNGYFNLIADFNGTHSKRSYSHPVTETKGTRYLWAFLRSKSEQNLQDRAIIYSINVTNTVDGGASTCLPCPSTKDSNNRCIPCEPGHFMTEIDRICTKCPPNSVLNSSGDGIGPKNCLACGPYLISDDGVNCYTDGILAISTDNNRTSKYDLSQLAASPLNASGVRVFAHQGGGYLHWFNISFIGPSPYASCRDTYKYTDNVGLGTRFKLEMKALVCRATQLSETKGNSTESVFVAPIALATRLIGISSHPEFANIKMNDLELDLESNKTDEFSNVYFFFDVIPNSVSKNCPFGQSTVVSTRCDPNFHKAYARLPLKCPDGTCNGCLYHILIISADACPICIEDDYRLIRGECLNGYQTIHSIPSKYIDEFGMHCILSGEQGKERQEACRLFGIQVQLFVGFSTSFGIILCVLIVVILKRNRKLEYKYMKLIEAKAGVDAVELPTVDSCGLEDYEEEDTARIVFSKGTKNQNRLSGQDGDENSAFIALEQED